MNFAENLKILRNAKQISQTKLATELNISTKTNSHWETGYSEPSISQLIQLSNFFEITVDELVGKID